MSPSKFALAPVAFGGNAPLAMASGAAAAARWGGAAALLGAVRWAGVDAVGVDDCLLKAVVVAGGALDTSATDFAFCGGGGGGFGAATATGAAGGACVVETTAVVVLVAVFIFLRLL